MNNPPAVAEIEAQCQALFSQLTELQKTIRDKLSAHADGKNLKGNEIVGWLGEIYGKLLFDGTLVDDREEHDFVSKDGLRVSVKTRKGWNFGWKQGSAIPRIEGIDCPTHLLFVHLNDDYSIDRMWLLGWQQLLDTHRFKKHMVRGSQRSFIFTIDECVDESCLVYAPGHCQTLGAIKTTAADRAPHSGAPRPLTGDTDLNETEKRGAKIKDLAAQIILEYLRSHTDARPTGSGVKQATIFHDCGFGWGDFQRATDSQQQFWIVGALYHLQSAGQVIRVRERGPWRLV